MRICLKILVLCLLVSCAQDELIDIESTYPDFFTEFNSQIDLNNLPDYEGQSVPGYINQDNTGSNFITNKGATLGRILFYDRKLSSDGSVSCSTCHQQENAFSDIADVSTAAVLNKNLHLNLINL